MIRLARSCVRAILETRARGLTTRNFDHSRRSAFACERARVDAIAAGISRSTRFLPRIDATARAPLCERPERPHRGVAFPHPAVPPVARPVSSDPAGIAMARG